MKKVPLASLLSTCSGGLGFDSRRAGLFDAVAMFPLSDSLENLNWCLQSSLRSQTVALSLPNPLSFKSGSPCVPLGEDVEIRQAEPLWNHLKCLWNATPCLVSNCSWYSLLYVPLLVPELANHKWWSPLAAPLPVILIKLLMKDRLIMSAEAAQVIYLSEQSAPRHVGTAARMLLFSPHINLRPPYMYKNNTWHLIKQLFISYYSIFAQRLENNSWSMQRILLMLVWWALKQSWRKCFRSILPIHLAPTSKQQNLPSRQYF